MRLPRVLRKSCGRGRRVLSSLQSFASSSSRLHAVLEDSTGPSPSIAGNTQGQSFGASFRRSLSIATTSGMAVSGIVCPPRPSLHVSRGSPPCGIVARQRDIRPASPAAGAHALQRPDRQRGQVTPERIVFDHSRVEPLPLGISKNTLPRDLRGLRHPGRAACRDRGICTPPEPRVCGNREDVPPKLKSSIRLHRRLGLKLGVDVQELVGKPLERERLMGRCRGIHEIFVELRRAFRRRSLTTAAPGEPSAGRAGREHVVNNAREDRRLVARSIARGAWSQDPCR